jgi:protoheme IX farnesyltransferase
MTVAEAIHSYLGLCKVTISFFASLSAATGLLLANHPSGTALPVLLMGVFLMACGASALNHYQERRTDALMPRTAGRPIPSGKIQPVNALRFSLALIGSGATILLSSGLWISTLLGLAAVLWYNGFYTWLKAHNAFAAIPGALVGAIPPAIGWMAGGGCLSDARLAVICFFFFMWQVPHFLIHQLVFGKEYEKIHLPSLTAVLTEAQLDRLTFQWILAAAVSLQLFIFHGLIQSSLVHISLLAASLWLIAKGVPLLRKRTPNYPGIFMNTNYFIFVVMFFIIVDRLSRSLSWAG